MFSFIFKLPIQDFEKNLNANGLTKIPHYKVLLLPCLKSFYVFALSCLFVHYSQGYIPSNKPITLMAKATITIVYILTVKVQMPFGQYLTPSHVKDMAHTSMVHLKFPLNQCLLCVRFLYPFMVSHTLFDLGFVSYSFFLFSQLLNCR